MFIWGSSQTVELSDCLLDLIDMVLSCLERLAVNIRISSITAAIGLSLEAIPKELDCRLKHSQ